MATKRTPVNFRTYYKLFIEQYKAKRNELIVRKNNLKFDIDSEKKVIVKDIQIYKDKFGINLGEYKEFVNSEYEDGTLEKLAKGLYFNRKDDYIALAETLVLYSFAKKLTEVKEVKEELEFVNKCTIITLEEYTNILKVYYFKVHELMIIEGCGYKIDNGLGWLCINRCKKEKGRKVLDFAATKKKEKEIIANGGRIYNKEQDEWCKANGIKYEYTDKRVYLNQEYVYEVAWIKPNITNASLFKFEVSDYRGRELRGKTNEELVSLSNNDLKKVCNMPLDIKTKLIICININKKLYFKFIRNETQKSITYKSFDR